MPCGVDPPTLGPTPRTPRENWMPHPRKTEALSHQVREMPGSRLKLAPGKTQGLGSVRVLPGAPTHGVLGDVKVSEGSWDAQGGVGSQSVTG